MAIEQVEEQDGGDLVKVMREFHTLPCKVTKADQAKAAQDLADALEEIEIVNDELKELKARCKARIEKAVKRTKELVATVQKGTVMQSVECELQLNFNTVTASLYRLDTDDIVNQRPMTDEERRMEATEEIPFGNEDGDAA